MARPQWLASLFVTEAPHLRRYLRRFGSETSAEDLAQESFAKLCDVDHAAVESPRALLFRTARNLALNDLRHRKVVSMQSVADVDALGATADDPTPEEQAICSQELALLRHALAALPAKHREALILFKLEGWSYREIGKKLGVSHRTVERYVADAITRCHLVLRAKARQD